MEAKKFTYESKTGSVFECFLYEPEDHPFAVVQIIPELFPDDAFYDSLIEYLNKNGISVIYSKNQKASGCDFDKIMIEDLASVARIAKKRYRHLPYFVYAREEGALASAAFSCVFEGIDGAIFSNVFFLERLSFFKKRSYMKKALKTPMETDKSFVSAYFDPEKIKGSEELVNYSFSYSIIKLSSYSFTNEWALDMKKSLPILFLSKEKDEDNIEKVKALSEKMNDLDFSFVESDIISGNEKEKIFEFVKCRAQEALEARRAEY